MATTSGVKASTAQEVLLVGFVASPDAVVFQGMPVWYGQIGTVFVLGSYEVLVLVQVYLGSMSEFRMESVISGSKVKIHWRNAWRLGRVHLVSSTYKTVSNQSTRRIRSFSAPFRRGHSRVEGKPLKKRSAAS